MAELLRYQWFRGQLDAAGWVSGNLIIGTLPETSMEEIYLALNSRTPGEKVFLVVFNVENFQTQGVYAIIPIRVPHAPPLMVSRSWVPWRLADEQ